MVPSLGNSLYPMEFEDLVEIWESPGRRQISVEWHNLSENGELMR
jgi:hypothetical protein